MKTRKEIVNIITIPPDKSVEITIGGMFYQRLNKLLVETADQLGDKTLIKCMAKISRNYDLSNDHTAFNLETLMILIQAIEKEFQNKDYAVDNEIEFELSDDWKIPAPNVDDTEK